MWEEVQAALEWQRGIVRLIDARWRTYLGKHYSDRIDGDDSVENSPFEVVANIAPHLFYSNPKFNLSDVGGASNDTIAADQTALNSLMGQIKFERTARRVVIDALFGFGVFMVGAQVVPGYEQWPGIKPMRPMVWRIPPRRFFRDARNGEAPRFDGHIWVKDIGDLLNEKDRDGKPVYDEKQLRNIAGDLGLEQAGLPARASEGPERNQIVGYEFYCGETGMIYSLAAFPSGRSEYIRAPRPWIGTPAGPYHEVGMYPAGEEPYPHSTLGASQRTAEDVNLHARAIGKAAGESKRLVFVNAKVKQLKQSAAHGQSGSVYALEGVSEKDVVKVDIDGASPEWLKYHALSRERLDRQTGLTDARRGNLDPEVTATAEAVADRAADVRMADNKRSVRMAVIAVAEECLFIMQRYRSISFRVRTEDPQGGGPSSGTYVGGPPPGAEPARQQTTSVEIEPYSMEYANQALMQARTNEMIRQSVDLANQALVNPALKVRDMLNDLGQAHNISQAADRYVDFQILQQMQLAAMLSRTAPGGPMGPPAPAGPGGPGGSGSPPGGPDQQTVNDPGVDPVHEQAGMLAEAAATI